MNYQLADGSWSLDYEIGDQFIYIGNNLGETLKFSENDCSCHPYFLWGDDKYPNPCAWERLILKKRNKTAKEVKTLTVETQDKISSLHSDIQMLVASSNIEALNKLLNKLEEIYQEELRS